MIFADRIRMTLKEGDGRRALRLPDRDITFAELLTRVEGWRRFLDELGVGAEKRVALALEGGLELVAAHAGNLLAGRVTVPINPRLPAAETAAILERSGASLLIAENAIAADPERAITRHVLERRLVPAAFSAARRTPDRHDAPPIDGDTLALLPFTSGTTGRPKGVELTHGNLEASALALTEAWELSPDDELLLTLPLFHVHGLCVGVHGMLARGHGVTLLPRFDADDVLTRLSAPDGPTLFYGVPTLYTRLVRAARGRRRPWSNVRLAVSGSAPLPVELRARCRELFEVDILERYGMTETLMNLGQPLSGPRRPGWLGGPLPGVEVRIVDPAGADVAPGTEGELLVRGPAVTRGYWRDGAASDAAFQDGWFRTGDLGVRDPDHGEYRITGRKKELIITGGLNVHPREVEECLTAHPSVSEAAVSGVPDADLGEAVAAWVVPQEDITADELIAWCRDRLAHYRKPRHVIFVEALPRNAVGKIRRHELPPPL